MPSKPGSALLFDIDGTLADTDDLHLQAFNTVFGPLGHTFDHARFIKELQGFSMASIQERFLGQLPIPRQVALMAEKEMAFRTLAASNMRPTPGLMTLLDWADREGVLMAAVTNAPRLNAEMVLSRLGIWHRFKALVIGDELAHGKPHPLPYLEGMRLIGAKPEVSVAFEDSRAGVQSATAAGIATAGIRTSVRHADLTAAGAEMSAADFADPALLTFVAAKLGRAGHVL